MYNNDTKKLLTVLISTLLVVAAAIETDIFIPSFPAIKEFFATTPAKVQMLVSVNFLGLCLSAIVYGPLSDIYGRRGVLLVGLGFFSLGAIGCVLAHSLNWIIFWRFIEGLGSSACFVIPATIYFDLYKPEQAVKIVGITNSIITIFMSGSPLLGGYLHLTYGFKANFLFIAGFAVLGLVLTIFCVKESLPVEQRKNLNLNSMARSFMGILSVPKGYGHLISISAIFGSYMVFVSGQSLIFVDNLHVTERAFPFYQGALVIVFAILSIFSGNIINKYGMKNSMRYSTYFSFTAALLLQLIAIIKPESPIYLTSAMCLCAIGFAILFNAIFSDYMNSFPNDKGIASALMTTTRLMGASLFIAITGKFFDGTIHPVAIAISVLSFAYLAMYWLWVLQPNKTSAKS